MTETSPANAQPSKTKFVLTLLMHQLIGTLGVVMLATMLTTVALEIPNPWGGLPQRGMTFTACSLDRRSFLRRSWSRF
jgi:hypothetical protein